MNAEMNAEMNAALLLKSASGSEFAILKSTLMLCLAPYLAHALTENSPFSGASLKKADIFGHPKLIFGNI